MFHHVIWARKHGDINWGILNIIEPADGGAVKAQKLLHGWSTALPDHQFRVEETDKVNKCQPVNNRGFDA